MTGQRQELTAAGRRVHRLLAAPTVAGHVALAFSRPSRQVAVKAWIVAMRRTFGRDTTHGRAEKYVREVLHSPGRSFPPFRARRRPGPDTPSRLVVAALENGAPALSAWSALGGDQGWAVTLLTGLAQTRFAAGAGLTELVRAAELRVDRERRIAGHGSRLTPVPGARPGAPRTVLGQDLRAGAMFDPARPGDLPKEPSAEAAVAFWRTAALAALDRRFAPDPPAEAVAVFARRVAVLATDPRLDEATTLAVVRAALEARPETPAGLSPDLVHQAMAVVFVQAAEDLAWYEREIDDLLCGVEREVAGQGFRLLPMP
ncbi:MULTISPECIES: hypothetical protein [Polymorphospora]|uniref:Uncharacterized protein n=1 Tax=Polymorphospora lycopeni TaxID=3140240 RepID=A0ABV5CLS3_9ACTN